MIRPLPPDPREKTAKAPPPTLPGARSSETTNTTLDATLKEHPVAFWFGVVLMAASFLVYPAYLVIAFLPLPAATLMGFDIVASLSSWAIFFYGSVLAGPEGWKLLKAIFARRGTAAP